MKAVFAKAGRIAPVLLFVLSLGACTTSEQTAGTASSSAIVSVQDSSRSASSQAGSGTVSEEKTFTVHVILPDGTERDYPYTSDAQMLVTPLRESGLISGDEGEFGLYVKTVDGVTADYDTDGSWWKLSVNGVESPVGASDCPIEEGAVYTWEYVH